MASDIRRRSARKKQGTASPRARTRSTAAVHELLPLHHRLYLVMRNRLTQGDYPGQFPLPGEHQLAAEFNVSRETLRRVLERLAAEKLVERRQGVGTFPAGASQPAAPSEGRLSYYDFIAQTSHQYQDTLLEFTSLATPAAVLAEVPDFGARALKISRLRRHNGEARHIADSYVPAPLAVHLSRDSLGNRTVLEILGEHGIVVEASDMWISAVAADAQEAQHLAVAIGAPLVHATRVSRDARGRVLEFTRFHSVAEQFGYRLHFDRHSIRVGLTVDGQEPEPAAD